MATLMLFFDRVIPFSRHIKLACMGALSLHRPKPMLCPEWSDPSEFPLLELSTQLSREEFYERNK
jgi:hypothetical protein